MSAGARECAWCFAREPATTAMRSAIAGQPKREIASGVPRSDADAFPQHHQLSEVIGVVISYEQRFSQNCLAVTPRELRIKIGLLVGDQALHCSQVFLECGYASLPRFFIGWCIGPRPVSVGPV